MLDGSFHISAFPEAASRESELQLQNPAESTSCRAAKRFPQHTQMNPLSELVEFVLSRSVCSHVKNQQAKSCKIRHAAECNSSHLLSVLAPRRLRAANSCVPPCIKPSLTNQQPPVSFRLSVYNFFCK